MKSTKRRFGWMTVAVVLLVLVSGCNIFEFATDKEKTPTDTAEEAIRDGDYAKARDAIAKSVHDSTDAMSLYLNAKIALLESGINYAEIVDLVEGSDASAGDDLAILNTIDAKTLSEQETWYRKNMEIRANLIRIFSCSNNDVLSKEDVSLDYSIANLLTGVLGLRDTNRDGFINDNDFKLDLNFVNNIGTTNTTGYNISGGSFVDENGESVMFQGLSVFLGNASGAPKIAANHPKGKPGYNPGMINQLLAFVLDMLADGSDGINTLISQNVDSSYDAEDIDDLIEEIASIINFYWHNDGIDNDGDGHIDEELIDGIDNDQDGLIDEDTDYTDPNSSAHLGEENRNYFWNVKENEDKDENKNYVAVWNKWKNKI